MVDVDDTILHIEVFDGQSAEFRNSKTGMKLNVEDFVILAVHIIVMYELEELSHLVFCDCLSCNCIIYQYPGKLKSEWILYQNVIIHRHLKGWSKYSPYGVDGTVTLAIFLLQLYQEQLCIGGFHYSNFLLSMSKIIVFDF